MRVCLSLVVVLGPLAIAASGQGTATPPARGAFGAFQAGPASPAESLADRADRLVRTICNKREVKLAREDAVRELARIVPPRSRVAVLVEVMKAKDVDTVEPLGPRWDAYSVQPGFVRTHVIQAILSLTPDEARAATPALIGVMLRDEVAEVRAIATLALARVAPSDEAVVRAFVQVLRSRDVLSWQAAAAGLGQAGARGDLGRTELTRLASMGEPRGTDLASIATMNATIEARQALLKIDRALAAQPPAPLLIPNPPGRAASLPRTGPQPSEDVVPNPYLDEGNSNQAQADVNRLLKQSLGSIDENYRGTHQYFNDDLIGRAMEASGKFIADQVRRALSDPK